MKNLIAFLFVLIGFAASAQSKMVLDSTQHDFGRLNEGDRVTYEFTYTNTGNQPLVILSVTQPCGCTTPKYSQEPLMPGKTAKITVVYDSEGHPGVFNKKLQIRCNDSMQYYDIVIMGEVLPKPTPQPPAETN